MSVKERSLLVPVQKCLEERFELIVESGTRDVQSDREQIGEQKTCVYAREI